MLTRKQKELLLFIHERTKNGDIAPSFEEMKSHLGLKSKSGIHRLITALVERGFIERLPHRARALNVIKLPPGYEDRGHNKSSTDAPYSDTLSKGRNSYTHNTSPIRDIPLYGKIAAGTPIEAIRNESGTMSIHASTIRPGKEYYALQVDGDSMIKAGINDKDFVIIRKQDNAENGDIVVALIDNEEVTLKRFRRKGPVIDLVPENDRFDVQSFSEDRVKIQGVLSTLIRSYEIH